MKIRNGFVSNSSSSSFVVLLPKNFDPDLFTDNLTEEQLNPDKWSDYDREEVREALRTLVRDGSIHQYDDSHNMYMCSEMLREYVIVSTEGGPDDGSISIITDSERQRIKELLNKEIRYDKFKKINENEN